VDGPDWTRLATYVRARRGQLGLTQATLAEQAGVSVKTINGIETRPTPRRVDTMSGLERALGWASGSIEEILAGRPPLWAGAVADTPPAPAVLVTGPGADHSIRRVVELMDEMPRDARLAIEQMIAVIAPLLTPRITSDPFTTHRLPSGALAISRSTALLDEHTTAQLERTAAEGATEPAQDERDAQ
jgi:hypothetical protein